MRRKRSMVAALAGVPPTRIPAIRVSVASSFLMPHLVVIGIVISSHAR